MLVLEKLDLPCHLIHLESDVVAEDENKAQESREEAFKSTMNSKLFSIYELKENLDYHLVWEPYRLPKDSYEADIKITKDNYMKYALCNSAQTVVPMRI
jgi:hypothetical protein